MNLRRVLALTAVAHVVLALAVAWHARATGRDDGGRWALATLLGGLVGVAGYRLRRP
jgi:hypothetical protein